MSLSSVGADRTIVIFLTSCPPRTIPLLARGARTGFTKTSTPIEPAKTERYRLIPPHTYGNDDAVRKPVYANTTALVMPARLYVRCPDRMSPIRRPPPPRDTQDGGQTAASFLYGNNVSRDLSRGKRTVPSRGSIRVLSLIPVTLLARRNINKRRLL